MTEIINLNKRRKAKLRVEKEVRATENRLKHGRTKHEKLAEKTRLEQLARHVDAHRRDPNDA